MSGPAPDGPAPAGTAGGASGPSLYPYFLILFGASAGLASIVVLLAELRSELGFSETGIGLAIASGFGAAFVAALVMAPHADRGWAPLMLRGGLAMAVVGMAILAVGHDLWHYVLGRAVFGFALGTAGPAARRTVIVADPANLGRNMGRLGAWDVGGFVAGPMIASSSSPTFLVFTTVNAKNTGGVLDSTARWHWIGGPISNVNRYPGLTTSTFGTISSERITAY